MDKLYGALVDWGSNGVSGGCGPRLHGCMWSRGCCCGGLQDWYVAAALRWLDEGLDIYGLMGSERSDGMGE